MFMAMQRTLAVMNNQENEKLFYFSGDSSYFMYRYNKVR
jgi:hypothetical protein